MTERGGNGALWVSVNELKKGLSDISTRVSINEKDIETQRMSTVDLVGKLASAEAKMQDSNMELSSKINSILIVGKTLMWVIPLTGALTVSGMGAVIWLYQNFSPTVGG